MAKTTSTVLGVAFLLVGVLGLAVPDFMGFHLGPAHSVVHLLTGVVALYLGLRGTMSAARWFCLIFGGVYGLLGIVGLIAGGHGMPSPSVPGPEDSHLLRVIPGMLELGTRDHLLHVLLGVVFLIGGLMTPVVGVETAQRPAH